MPRFDLHADCASCGALCCVAYPLEKSDDFALDKPAGEPCPHLTACGRCAIHDELVPRGFRGCAAFDCYGAGQRVTRAGGTLETFLLLREYHELLWLLTEALALTLPATAAKTLEAQRAELERRCADLTRLEPVPTALERRVRETLRTLAAFTSRRSLAPRHRG